MRKILCDMCGEMFGVVTDETVVTTRGFHRRIEEVEVSTPDGLIIEEHCSSCRTKTMRARGALFAVALFRGYADEGLEVERIVAQAAERRQWHIDQSTWHDAVAQEIAWRIDLAELKALGEPQ